MATSLSLNRLQEWDLQSHCHGDAGAAAAPKLRMRNVSVPVAQAAYKARRFQARASIEALLCLDAMVTPPEMQPLQECQLQDVMRRRREACAEFESKPAATTADATADAKPQGQATGPRQSLQTTDSLQELLSERRKRCEVLESSPLPQLADVLWNQEVSKTERSECERPAQESRADFKWDHPVVSARKEGAANETQDRRDATMQDKNPPNSRLLGFLLE